MRESVLMATRLEPVAGGAESDAELVTVLVDDSVVSVVLEDGSTLRFDVVELRQALNPLRRVA
jgi:hypothetical protein